MIDAAANRKVILDSLTARNVRVRLHPHSGDMEYQDCDGRLEMWERDAIEVCRVGLTRQLRAEGGKCLTCGGERQDKRAELCHSCIMRLGMPHYHRLMQGKNIAKQKPKPGVPEQNPDFAIPDLGEGE